MDAFFHYFYKCGVRDVSLVEAAMLIDKVKDVRDLEHPSNPNDPFEWFRRNCKPGTAISYGK